MTRRLLMHVGPSIIETEVLLAGVKENVGFTSPEFIEAMGNALRGVRKVMGADNTYQPFIIPGSGTAAMESVTSLLRKGDRVLVVSNGVFGDRWEAILRKYPLEVKVLRAGPGDAVSEAEILREVEGGKYKMITMTHVETSTGVKMPVGEVSRKLRDHVEIITVDGVASVGGEEVKAREWGVDIYLTASQKALGCPPGAGILVLSERATNTISTQSVAGYFLDLGNWLQVMRNMEEGRGGYFATLPVHLVFSISKALEMIEEEGLENRFRRHALVAGTIRAGVEGMGKRVVAKRGLYSNTVTGVEVERVNPSDVLKTTISGGLELAPGVHPALKYFRRGHMGWINPNDAISTIAVVERTLSKLGEPVKVGEGLRSAQEFLSANS
jgi:aspartate aminotransferase-like enzyme